MSSLVDTDELTSKVKEMYRQVAEKPDAGYHFELGRPLAARLGYDLDLLDLVPTGAVDSFAGVGYFFDLADLSDGETVVDLGSGSGMDAFYAAQLVGPSGRVVGIDFTAEQLEKARRLAAGAGISGGRVPRGAHRGPPSQRWERRLCHFQRCHQSLARQDASFRRRGAGAASRRPLALADIVTERQLAKAIIANADLWASCIGGAAQEDEYRAAIEAAGLHVTDVRRNAYEFISTQARNASGTYGVKSISLLATKPSP
jgi:arsenite methyltransferase